MRPSSCTEPTRSFVDINVAQGNPEYWDYTLVRLHIPIAGAPTLTGGNAL